MIKTIVLEGVSIPYHSVMDLNCEYLPRTRETIISLADGSIVKQTFGGSQSKLDILLSGAGNIPPGLDGLDYTGELLFSGAAELSITSAATSILLPTERRSDADYLPWGRASINNRWVSTPVGMTGDQADLTPVVGADLYQVLWYPEFLVLSDGGRPSLNHDVNQASTSWILRLKQV